jgi:hypothetical protein
MTQSNETPAARSRWEKRLTTGLIVLGLLLVLFFGFRAVRSFLRIQFTGLEPGVTDVELIRGWMTIPYIATSYNVPEEYLFEQIGVPQQADNQKKSLYRLNADYFGGEPEAIRKVVQAAILKYQAEHPSPQESNHE